MKPIRLDDFLSICATSFEFDVAYDFDPETGHPLQIGYAVLWKEEPEGKSLVVRPENEGGRIYFLASQYEVTRLGFRKSEGRAIIDIRRKLP